MLFEIFVGLVLFIAFVGALIDQAPKKKKKEIKTINRIKDY